MQRRNGRTPGWRCGLAVLWTIELMCISPPWRLLPNSLTPCRFVALAARDYTWTDYSWYFQNVVKVRYAVLPLLAMMLLLVQAGGGFGASGNPQQPQRRGRDSSSWYTAAQRAAFTRFPHHHNASGSHVYHSYE